MKVRLIRKFAEVIDGVDLSKAREGETLDLSARDANLLMAEGWAEQEWAEQEGGTPARDQAHDQPRRKRTPRSAKKR